MGCGGRGPGAAAAGAGARCCLLVVCYSSVRERALVFVSFPLEVAVAVAVAVALHVVGSAAATLTALDARCQPLARTVPSKFSRGLINNGDKCGLPGCSLAVWWQAWWRCLARIGVCRQELAARGPTRID